MEERRKIKPRVPGETVFDPETRILLADEGEEKRMSDFWLRRVRLGDVVYVDDPAPIVSSVSIPKQKLMKQET